MLIGVDIRTGASQEIVYFMTTIILFPPLKDCVNS